MKSKNIKEKRKKTSLYYFLLKSNVLSVLILSLIVIIFSAKSFEKAIHEEVKIGLVDISDTVVILYDRIYPGDYSAIQQEDGIYLLKGGNQLNGDFEVIDQVKEKTGVDITLTYEDTRVITTLKNSAGQRLVGTRVGTAIKKAVFEQGISQFYSEVMIEGVKYFSYYAPLKNVDGNAVGMIFVAKPSKEVDKLVREAVFPIFLIGIFSAFIVAYVTIRFSNELTRNIEKIEIFLDNISKGNLRAEISPEVLARQDELGDMGKHAVQMQKSLRELVEQDILTGLNNRRSGEKKLKQVQAENTKTGLPFCVAIGDIDHFKKVNDTYGHDCGDVVLANIAARLQRNMKGNGFAVRWGGEEFLLIYDRSNKSRAVGCLEDLMQEIRAAKIQYGDETVQVTVTFGVEEGSEENIDYIIRKADEKLYYGKNNGRNQIVE